MCEAPTFTEWSTMMVPTYVEDGSRALKVYQHQHHMVVRVGHKAPTMSSEMKEPLLYLETASTDSAGTFTR